jgi:nucleoside-diphosphate-sugar epimerase
MSAQFYAATVAGILVLGLSWLGGGWIATYLSPKYGLGDVPSLAGKVAVVTGSTSGIGFVTARELVRKGCHVFVAARSPSKGLQAVKSIAAATGRTIGAGQIDFVPLDLGSFASVRQFVRDFRGKASRLDILVNNAGVYEPSEPTTEDGYETTIQTNHLGHFLLCKLLMPMIRYSKTRVVHVSSALEANSYKEGIRFETFKYKQTTYDPFTAYSQSKLANVLFSHELARRLNGTGATSNAVHPGIIATQLQRSAYEFTPSNFLSKLPGVIFMSLFNAAAATPDNGALTQLFVATSPMVEGVTGRYFVPIALDRTQSASAQSRNVTLQQLLWKESDKIVG